MKPQKLHSEPVEESVLESTQKQNPQVTSEAKITVKLTEVKENKISKLTTYQHDDWDNWYPDPS